MIIKRQSGAVRLYVRGLVRMVSLIATRDTTGLLNEFALRFMLSALDSNQSLRKESETARKSIFGGQRQRAE